MLQLIRPAVAMTVLFTLLLGLGRAAAQAQGDDGDQAGAAEQGVIGARGFRGVAFRHDGVLPLRPGRGRR